MKIKNNFNKSALVHAIKYPFVKIASLFQRVVLANRMHGIQNGGPLSDGSSLRSSHNSNVIARKDSLSNSPIEENDYQEIDAFRENSESDTSKGTERLFQTIDPTHLYTKINKTNNGKIDRYLPSDENITPSHGNNNGLEHKRGQPHPFLTETKEMAVTPPAVPAKNRALIQDVLKRDAFRMQLPRASTMMRLTILKGSEISI